MSSFFPFIFGLAGGFFMHSFSMKINFKQHSIKRKTKAYGLIISQWVRMRNLIYSTHPDLTGKTISAEDRAEIDRHYGDSQQFIAEIILISESKELSSEINSLNEKLYRSEWEIQDIDQSNEIMEKIKSDAVLLIDRMREDIKTDTIFSLQDFKHVFSGWK